MLVNAAVAVSELEKTVLDRGRTDRISLTNDLDLDLDQQFPASYSHRLRTCKSSRSTVSRFRRQWKQTDTQMDRQTDGGDDCNYLPGYCGR